MIKIDRLNKTYASGGNTITHAVRDLSLEVAPGSFTIVIGNNGSGKSTLINLLAGTQIPDSGEIYFDGQGVHPLPDFKRAAYIGRVFQDPMKGTAGELSILENLRLASIAATTKSLKVGTGKAFRKEMSTLVATLHLGLEDKLDQAVHQLSGGQRQAISLLMAIIHHPKILLLDEPTAALDPEAAKNILKIADTLIRERNLTALLVTHNMNEATQYGDRLIQLEHGRIKRDLVGREKEVLEPIDVMMWFQGG